MTEIELWMGRLASTTRRIVQDVTVGRMPAKDDMERYNRYLRSYLAAGGAPFTPDTQATA